MNGRTIRGSALFILLFVTATCVAQTVDVRNVAFEQKGEAIFIRYDLQGIAGKKYQVTVRLSSDYGNTFRIEPKSLAGDAGKNVLPGAGREIRWDFLRDYPNGLEGEGFVFSVEARLQKKAVTWPYIAGGGAVALGAALYFVVTGAGKENTGSFSISVPGDI